MRDGDARKPSFAGLRSASRRASVSARGASVKRHTRCEVALRKELHRRGLRFRLHGEGLPGCPDIVFAKSRLAVFCDGDFWHGRDLEQRLAKLRQGHNPQYWVAKVRRNVERDQARAWSLQVSGWTVLRLWETDILRDVAAAADAVEAALRCSSVR